MADDTGTGEAKQLMELLWRHAVPPRAGGRGPKQKVSVDAVVAAAVALADRDGYEKVSIRAVAAELGLRPMSLYTYVPSKEALAVLMVDAVATHDAPIPADAAPRDRMGAIARQVRSELLAHPWLLDISPWRLVLGPGRMLRYERQLAAIDGIGLSDLDMDRVIAVLSEFAAGNARMAIAAVRGAAQRSDAQWWEEHGPLLDQLMPVAEFPLSSRVGAAVGEYYQAPADPDDAFEFGLNRLLDGIFAEVAGSAD